MTQTENEKVLQAALGGDVESQYQMGILFARGDTGSVDLGEAAQWFRKAGEQGHPDALCNYAFLLYSGNGVEKDVERSVELFEQAAKLGQKQAMLNLGIYYINHDVPQIEKGMDYLKTAAKEGEAEAAYTLGILYFEGKKVPQDLELARKCFEQGAEMGEPESLYSLGFLYSKGYGVEKDPAKAVEYYRVAAEKGHASAQFNLGLHYEYGEGGLEKDSEEAVFWYQKASNQGHQKASEAIQLLDSSGS